MTEEIKNDIDKLDGMTKIKGKCGYEIIGGCSDLRRLEQENKELRQQYNCYACDTCQGKEDYRNMKRHCENAIKTVHTYRSALEEIREDLETQVYCECSECGNDDYGECIKCMTKRYMEKINEVIGYE